MSSSSTHDPRVVLVREKYFSLRPEPLERYLWQRGLPQSAERVFWFHWQEGHRAGDWVSQVPLTRVAAACCLDVSTVTRAYQLLKNLGLIRRADPGRDPANPFQQATAITEVRVPRELTVELSRSPNRHKRSDPATSSAMPTRTVSIPQEISSPQLTRDASRALYRKFSDNESRAFFLASRNRATTLPFDDATALTAEERGIVLMQLERLAREVAEPAAEPQEQQSRSSPGFAKPRRLSPLDAARTRKRVLALVPASTANDVLRQILWSVEEGALRRFEMPLALNIALKKIRDGAWTRPHRMPPNWLRVLASPEPCSAA